MDPHSVMLVPARDYSPLPRSPKDIDDTQPQASNFFYLSGYQDKQALILLWRGQDNKKDSTGHIIFAPTPNPLTSLWTGELPAPAKLAKSMSFDQGLPLYSFDDSFDDAFDDFIKEKLLGVDNIYYPIGENPQLDNYICNLVNQLSNRGLRQGLATPHNLKTSDNIFATMRLVKSSTELAMIKLAANISVGGHKRLADRLPSLEYEYQGEAELSYHYRFHGATAAFPSIVAAGKNACVLHYTKNDISINPSDALLVDSGAAIGHYVADMTRCYPPKVLKTKRAQAYLQVYQEVLSVHKRLCRAVKPGMTLADLHNKAVGWLVDSLLKLGIMQGERREIIRAGSYKRYYPHQTSHWIGLDVHDLGIYKKQELGKGMVFSIEPGLYISPTDKQVASHWRGIGVRIEDTIAITPAGIVENLTQDMPYWQNS